MAESLPMTKKKVIKRTLVETEETYEMVPLNENNPTDSGKPPPYSDDDPVRPLEKRITGELGEASLPSLFDIFKCV